MYPSQAKTTSFTSSNTVCHSTPVVFGHEVDWSKMCSRYESGSLKGKPSWLWLPSRLTRRYSSILELSSGSILKYKLYVQSLFRRWQMQNWQRVSTYLKSMVERAWLLGTSIVYGGRWVSEAFITFEKEAVKALHHDSIRTIGLPLLCWKRKDGWVSLYLIRQEQKSVYHFLLYSK